MSNRFNCLKPESTNEKDAHRPTNRFLRKSSLKKNTRWKRDDEPAKHDSLPVNSRWNFTSTSPKNNAFKKSYKKNDRFFENNAEDNSFRKGNLGRRNNRYSRNSRFSHRHTDSNDSPRIQGRVIGQLDLGLALQKRQRKCPKSPDKNIKNDNKKKESTAKKLIPFKKKNDDNYSIPSKDDNLKKLILAQYALCSESESESEDEELL